MPNQTTSATTSHHHLAQTYDNTAYEGTTYGQTHPEHLAALAVLHGHEPVSPVGARVLEIGCATGSNLIPMAAYAPHAEFVGIDISEAQIKTAEKRAQDAGLTNIRFEVRGLETLNENEKFDYVIAHGVMSWIPQALQNELTQACARALSAQGIAYISYNTYPGWHLKNVAKDLMKFRAATVSDPGQRVPAALDTLKLFATEAIQREDFPLRQIYKTQHQQLAEQPAFYIEHEHLEPFNFPLYFSEFHAMADEAGLTYLCDAKLGENFLASTLSDTFRHQLTELCQSRAEVEQYLDFACSRTFRASLLVKSATPISPVIDPERIRRLLFLSDLRPQQAVATWDTTEPVRFAAEQRPEHVVTLKNPITKALLFGLSQAWPQGLNFNDAFHVAYRALGRDITKTPVEQIKAEIPVLCSEILHLQAAGHLTRLRVSKPNCTYQISDYPRLAPLPAAQLRSGQTVLVGALHQNLTPDRTARLILGLLTGANSRQTIAKRAAELAPSLSPAQVGELLEFARASGLLIS